MQNHHKIWFRLATAVLISAGAGLLADQEAHPVMHDDANGADGNSSMTVTIAEGEPVCPNPKHKCHEPGGPGRSDRFCCETICAVDPFCCEIEWDPICVSHMMSGTCEYSAPSNDQCRDSLKIQEVCLLAFTTIGATTDGPPHPGCAGKLGNPIQNDIWFDYMPSCTGLATISLCGSSFETALFVYAACGCDLHDGQLVACIADVCGPASELIIPVIGFNCYKIRIGNVGGTPGNGVLTITNNGTPCGEGPACVGDLAGDPNGNPDGFVDVDDLLFIINHWGCK